MIALALWLSDRPCNVPCCCAAEQHSAACLVDVDTLKAVQASRMSCAVLTVSGSSGGSSESGRFAMFGHVWHVYCDRADPVVE